MKRMWTWMRKIFWKYATRSDTPLRGRGFKRKNPSRIYEIYLGLLSLIFRPKVDETSPIIVILRKFNSLWFKACCIRHFILLIFSSTFFFTFSFLASVLSSTFFILFKCPHYSNCFLLFNFLFIGFNSSVCLISLFLLIDLWLISLISSLCAI